MRLIAKVTRISRAKFHCSRLTTVQDIQDYVSLIFWHTLYNEQNNTTEAMLCKRGLWHHAVSVCLSVCLSRSYILSKRIKISSKIFHHRVATPF